MTDLEERVRGEGLEFVSIGQSDHPVGSLPKSLEALGRLKGMAALRFTIQAVARTTAMMLRDAPAEIEKAGVSMLLVDQMEPAGSTLAELLGIGFITICNAMALNREPDVPPPFTPWSYRPTWWARLRNRAGNAMSDRLTDPITRVVDTYRKAHGLKRLRSPEASFSPVAQISQQPPLFDFPRRNLPSTFHYVGPLRKPRAQTIFFPWEKLDGRPIIYASLGTLQNARLDVFQCFAEACEGLDAQLVISHGGGLTTADVNRLPGNPLVVSYAPQLEVLSRASLTLTHGGLNTVLDSLSRGVPLIAMPITYEQPAIAERIRYTGVGLTFPLISLSVKRLRDAIGIALPEHSSVREGARGMRESIRGAGGVASAADIILRNQ